jgi:hypothetical protein
VIYCIHELMSRSKLMFEVDPSAVSPVSAVNTFSSRTDTDLVPRAAL